jgi:hypothetical protein
MEFEKCDCGKKATWIYMPGFKDGSPYFCDDCVHRGCSCNHRYVDVNVYHPPLDNPEMPEGIEGVNWKWIEQDNVWVYIDENGKEYPCCEYDYEENGFEIE